jgi:hypothetical protein
MGDRFRVRISKNGQLGEYLMIYKAPCFLASYDLAPPPPRQHVVYLSQSPECRRSSLLTGIRGVEGGVRSQIIRPQESLNLYTLS